MPRIRSLRVRTVSRCAAIEVRIRITGHTYVTVPHNWILQGELDLDNPWLRVLLFHRTSSFLRIYGLPTHSEPLAQLANTLGTTGFK
jgi:hypothetical protein